MKKIKLLFASSLLLLSPITACSGINSQQRSSQGVISVSIDVEYMKLEAGETLQLHPTVELAPGVDMANVYSKWMSSNEKVATVDENGLVLAIDSGRAVITYLVDIDKSVGCVIDVPFPDEGGGDTPIPPEPGPGPQPEPGEYAIYLNKTSETLEYYKTCQLTATQYNGEYEITWTSTGTVSVDQSGLVTAGGVAGEGTVTASANGVSVSCKFTVIDKGGEDTGKKVQFYFFIDYNNVDEKDTTQTRLLASFRWYPNQPLSGCDLLPQDPKNSQAPTSEFPYFVGWSYRAVVDDKKYLLNFESWPHDVQEGEDDIDLSTRNYVYIFGIWSDVPKEQF